MNCAGVWSIADKEIEEMGAIKSLLKRIEDLFPDAISSVVEDEEVATVVMHKPPNPSKSQFVLMKGDTDKYSIYYMLSVTTSKQFDTQAEKDERRENAKAAMADFMSYIKAKTG